MKKIVMLILAFTLLTGCATMDFKVGDGGCAVFKVTVPDPSSAGGLREVVLTACGENWDAAIAAVKNAVGGKVVALNDAKTCDGADCAKIAEAWLKKPVNDGDAEVKSLLNQ